MKVYLDDKRDPPSASGWVHTYSVKETIALLETGNVEQLSLDHDLGIEAEVGTGYDVLLWIEGKVLGENFRPPTIVVHSANPAARIRMELAIEVIERLASGRR